MLPERVFECMQVLSTSIMAANATLPKHYTEIWCWDSYVLTLHLHWVWNMSSNLHPVDWKTSHECLQPSLFWLCAAPSGNQRLKKARLRTLGPNCQTTQRLVLRKYYVRWHSAKRKNDLSFRNHINTKTAPNSWWKIFKFLFFMG